MLIPFSVTSVPVTALSRSILLPLARVRIARLLPGDTSLPYLALETTSGTPLNDRPIYIQETPATTSRRMAAANACNLPDNLLCTILVEVFICGLIRPEERRVGKEDGRKLKTQ